MTTPDETTEPTSIADQDAPANPEASAEPAPEAAEPSTTDDAATAGGQSPDAPSEIDAEEDFEALLDQYMGEDQQVGQLIQATIVAILDDGNVLLDVGDKAEGIAPVKEFQNFRGELEVAVGDVVEVVTERRDEEQRLRVSRRKARLQQDLKLLQAAMDSNATVPCLVEKVVNKGLLVLAGGGVQCFLPASQASLNKNEDLSKYVGQELEVHVLEVDHKRKRGVVSHRKVLAERQQAERADFLAGLQEGEFREGRVKNIAAFGVFVDLGPMDGLVPKAEVSWERNPKVEEVLKPGIRYKFKVLQVDKEGGRITLSRRQTKPDPWENIDEQFPIDSTVTAKVVSMNPKMAFLELADGIDGKILTENLSWLPSVRRPSDILNVGDEVQAVVLGHDRDRRNINLGLKQIETDPWSTVSERYPKGSRQTGTVTDFVDFGMFVSLEPAIKGLVHVSDLSHDPGVRDPKKVYKKGDQVEVVVLKIERDARKIALGIKQLEDDPFELFVSNNPMGSVVKATVKEVKDIILIVELARLVEGRLHISEWDRERVEKLTNVVKPGDEITAKILKIERKERRIALSRKKLMVEEERKAIDQYKKAGPVKASTSLGDLMRGLKLGGGVEVPKAPEPAAPQPEPQPETNAPDPIELAYQPEPQPEQFQQDPQFQPEPEPAPQPQFQPEPEQNFQPDQQYQADQQNQFEQPQQHNWNQPPQDLGGQQPNQGDQQNNPY